jgi:Putative adhesin
MHKPGFVFLLAVAVVSLAGCDIEAWGNAERFQEDFHQSHPLKAGGRLYIETFNGGVEISGWDQETADIRGTKYASTEQARNALRIDIVATGDSIRIRTVRPTDHRGNMGAKYVIKVPNRTLLERVETSNGAVKIDGIEGDARVRTSNGSVHAVRLKGAMDATTSNAAVELDQLQGSAVVNTSNGGIRASLREVAPRQSVKLTTSNGGIELTMDTFKENEIEANTSNAAITVHLPATTAARLKANTSNASVSSDLDVKTTGEPGKNRLEGAIGPGGPPITLTTSNGAIRIQKM